MGADFGARLESGEPACPARNIGEHNAAEAATDKIIPEMFECVFISTPLAVVALVSKAALFLG
jgi:hypothetical protein